MRKIQSIMADEWPPQRKKLIPASSPWTNDDSDTDVLDVETRVLVLHNDDVNTVEWVVSCLREVLKYSSDQAEQCAMIVHFKGRYGIKEGTYEQLKPYKDLLTEKLLEITIE